jgi:hypothetical protein
MAPLQGMLFTGLVLVFLFARPQGLLGKRLKRTQVPADDDEDDVLDQGAARP